MPSKKQQVQDSIKKGIQATKDSLKSSLINKKDKIKANAKNAVKEKQKESNDKIKGYTKKQKGQLNQQKEKYKQKKTTLKNNIKQNTNADSLKSKVKNKKDGLVNQQKQKIVVAKKQSKAYLLKKYNILKKPKPKFTGDFSIENYATNAQNPLMINSPYYSRVYFSPTFSLYGLPFTADVYYTTEDNSLYNSNTFSFNFDIQTFKDNISKELEKEIGAKKRLDRIRQFDLKNNLNQKDNIQQKIDDLKKQIPDTDKLKEQGENKITQQKENVKTKALDQKDKAKSGTKNALEKKKKKALGTIDEKKRGLKDEAKQKIDSKQKALNDKISSQKDSLVSNASDKNPLDSVNQEKINKRIEQVEKLEKQLKKLENAKNKLDKLRSADSLESNVKLKELQDPQKIKGFLKQKYGGNPLISTLLSVEQFQVGMAYPMYSKLTVQGIPVKGIDIHLNTGKLFYGLTLGRASRDDNMSFTNTKPDFKRNFAAAEFGIGNKEKTYIYIEGLKAKDMLKDKPFDFAAKNNWVFLVGGQYVIKDYLALKGSVAQSKYDINFNHPTSQIYVDTQLITTKRYNKNNFAYDVELKVTPTKNSTIKGFYKQVNPTFKSLGNPFLRTNYREFEIKAEQKLWKSKIIVSGFYKNNKDNIQETNPTTNKMSGYGFKARTKFKKLPNITFLYSPYQQGNNHPDSLLRTQNNYSITSTTITYFKRIKRTMLSTVINKTSSYMDFGSFEEPIKVNTISVSQSIQFGPKTSISLLYNRSRTYPQVDSNNVDAYFPNITYRVNKKLSLNMGIEYLRYQNGAFKKGVIFGFTYPIIKNMSLNLQSGYSNIHKLWGFEDKNIMFGRAVVRFRW